MHPRTHRLHGHHTPPQLKAPGPVPARGAGHMHVRAPGPTHTRAPESLPRGTYTCKGTGTSPANGTGDPSHLVQPGCLPPELALEGAAIIQGPQQKLPPNPLPVAPCVLPLPLEEVRAQGPAELYHSFQHGPGQLPSTGIQTPKGSGTAGAQPRGPGPTLGQGTRGTAVAGGAGPAPPPSANHRQPPLFRAAFAPQHSPFGREAPKRAVRIHV